MALRRLNWVEYALEAFGLGLFMISACGFGVLLFHPASPVVREIPSELARRAWMGAAMALTAILNTYAPWGRRSGAHLNPAVTLTFLRLGKVAPRDALGYVIAQFIGGVAGTALAAAALRPWIADPAVNYVATVPGPLGPAAAVAAEVAITFLVMAVVLALAPRPRLAPCTGLAVAGLVFLYITFETPISGMSMNPARSTGSAALAMSWSGLWIYFLAPPLGMLAAAELLRGASARAHCAKLMHDPAYRCAFCDWRKRQGTGNWE